MKSKRSLRGVHWVTSATELNWAVDDKLEISIECAPGPSGSTLSIHDVFSLN